MLKREKISTKGFTLVEMMVAVTLVSVLMLAVVQQSKLANDSKLDSVERVIINRVIDRVSVEMSRQETCTANFGAKAIVRTFAAAETITDGSGTAIAAVNGTYSDNDLTTNTLKKGQGKTVTISDIRTVAGGSDNEMILQISFQRKVGLGGVFKTSYKAELPISIMKDPGNVANVLYCYNDITNSIASAIRLSCQGNNSYYDTSPANLPYGKCVHLSDSTSCGPNQYLRRIEVLDASSSGTKTVKYTCASLPSCATGQVFKGFNADGSAVCDYPFVSCAAGELMVRSTGSGRYICLRSSPAPAAPGGGAYGCAGTYAIRSFNDDGSVTCQPFYPTATCPGGQKATAYYPDGGLSCSGAYRAVTCPAGYYIKSTDAAGNGVCSKYITVNYSCPGGQGANGIDAAGNLTCATLQRRWCNGTPSTKMNSTCTGAGGSVVNAGPNQVCQFNASSCPGGWSQCPTWAQTANASCSDLNSHCPSLVQTRTAYGAAWNSPVTPTSTSCYYWYDIPGDGVDYGSCGGYVYTTVTTPTTQVGCY